MLIYTRMSKLWSQLKETAKKIDTCGIRTHASYEIRMHCNQWKITLESDALDQLGQIVIVILLNFINSRRRKESKFWLNKDWFKNINLNKKPNQE